jgi:hypothetical protein
VTDYGGVLFTGRLMATVIVMVPSVSLLKGVPSPLYREIQESKCSSRKHVGLHIGRSFFDNVDALI